MNILLDKRFKNTAAGKFNKYEFEVGILKDKPYKKPKSKKAGFKPLAGGPSRKISSNQTGKKVSQISKFMRKKKNYLSNPFEQKSSDIIKFSKTFFDYVFGRTEERRLINLLQAIVRNPLTRGDYGPNKRRTVMNKGFDRYGIDSGQLFRSILARVKRV